MVPWCLWRYEEAGAEKRGKEPQVAALAQQCREDGRRPRYWATAPKGSELHWEPKRCWMHQIPAGGGTRGAARAAPIFVTT
eukprot:374587-Pleurochrysis_carterae.AAC.1